MTKIIVAAICAAVGAAAIANGQKAARQAPDDVLTGELERNLLAIRTASRSDLPNRLQTLAKLAKAHDVLPRLLAQYEEAPAEDYGTRRFLLGVIGELQDPRALEFFVKVLSTKLPSTKGGPDGFSVRDEEMIVLVKAVHAVGYMRSAQARQLLLETMQRHESHFVRVEAVRTYMWNSRNPTTDFSRRMSHD
jgi:HEAT repeat protein